MTTKNKNMSELFCPKYIIKVYERSMISSFKENFPNVSVRGCFFFPIFQGVFFCYIQSSGIQHWFADVANSHVILML